MEVGSDGRPGQPKRDPTLQDPLCVLQVMKRHYAAYTPAKVASICGCRPGEVVKVAELLCKIPAVSARRLSAMPWAGRSTVLALESSAPPPSCNCSWATWAGPAAGIIALRGHANVQGATDIPTLFNSLPNYLPAPHAVAAQATLRDYLANGHASGPRRGAAHDGLWQLETTQQAWASLSHYIVSLLKAWYGNGATAANEFGFQWLPKINEISPR